MLQAQASEASEAAEASVTELGDKYFVPWANMKERKKGNKRKATNELGCSDHTQAIEKREIAGEIVVEAPVASNTYQ